MENAGLGRGIGARTVVKYHVDQMRADGRAARIVQATLAAQPAVMITPAPAVMTGTSYSNAYKKAGKLDTSTSMGHEQIAKSVKHEFNLDSFDRKTVAKAPERVGLSPPEKGRPPTYPRAAETRVVDFILALRAMSLPTYSYVSAHVLLRRTPTPTTMLTSPSCNKSRLGISG